MPLPQGPWKLYDTVKQGDVLAQLDPKPLQDEMAALQQELSRLRKELDAMAARLAVSEADRGLTYMSEQVRLRLEVEQRSLIAMERQSEVAVNQIEAQRRSVYYDCLKPLFDKKIISQLELNNARYLRDEAQKRLAENTKVLHEAESDKSNAQARLEHIPKFLPADIEKELAPIAAAAAVQEAKITELETQMKLLTIYSPFDGMIAAINHWPQSAIKAGDTIVTVASDQRRYIVTYVRQEQHVAPEKDMEVDVRKRLAIAPVVRTKVECVGPQVEQIPVHLARDPKFPEWGLPVRITLPKDFSGYPGELFEVTFKTAGKGPRGGY